jgi:hypothetical protein
MMVAFILAAKLDDELRAHDWAKFARGYNGPQYAKHGYQTKLAAAFKRWSGIRDTAWSPSTIVAPPVEPIEEAKEIVVVERQEQPNAGDEKIAEPVPTPIAQGLSPFKQMNKPVAGAKAGLATGGISGAILLILARLGWLPDGLADPEVMLALGLIGAWLPGQIGSFVASYKARDLRFMPRRPEAQP